MVTKKKRTTVQIGKRSRAKGHDFERKIAIALRDIFPDARRNFEFRAVEARDGRDLIHTGHYRFQLKKLRKYASVATIKEARADELLGEVPVLVTAGDKEPAMVVLPFDHFLRLIAIEAEVSLTSNGDDWD